MTILNKSRNLEIIPGLAEQVYRAAVPAVPGHYASIRTSTMQFVMQPQPVVTVEVPPTINSYEDIYTLRPATYQEIELYLWRGPLSDLCGIRAFIMETNANTEFQFVPMYSLGFNTIFCVAWIESLGANGIARVDKTTEQSWPSETSIRNSTWDYLHGEGYGYWYFDDFYTCSIVDGVEEIEEK